MAHLKDRWRRLIARLAGDARGAAAMEAAIAAPLLLIFAVGTAEFGNMLYNANMIQTGVRDAARYLARVDDPQQAEPMARNLAVTGSIVGGASRRISWWGQNDISVSYRKIANPEDVTGYRDFRGGDEVTVIRVATEIDYGGLGTLRVVGQEAVRIGFAHEERFVGQ